MLFLKIKIWFTNYPKFQIPVIKDLLQKKDDIYENKYFNFKFKDFFVDWFQEKNSYYQSLKKYVITSYIIISMPTVYFYCLKDYMICWGYSVWGTLWGLKVFMGFICDCVTFVYSDGSGVFVE